MTNAQHQKKIIAAVNEFAMVAQVRFEFDIDLHVHIQRFNAQVRKLKAIRK